MSEGQNGCFHGFFFNDCGWYFFQAITHFDTVHDDLSDPVNLKKVPKLIIFIHQADFYIFKHNRYQRDEQQQQWLVLPVIFSIISGQTIFREFLNERRNLLSL